jgi:hypothetical protein
MARQARDRARSGPRLEEAPDSAVFDHGIGEHHVEPRLGGEPKARLTVRSCGIGFELAAMLVTLRLANRRR